MKRKPRLTKRQRKVLAPKKPADAGANRHIHCVACGAHLDPAEFDAQPATAKVLRCKHGSSFGACIACSPAAKRLLDEHDRSGQPVKAAEAWH